MADSYSGTVVGFDALIAELRRLPEVTQQRLMRGAMATAASVIRTEAVARAPVYVGADVMWGGSGGAGHTSGTLKRAIYQARLVSQCTPTAEVWLVSVRSGKLTARGKPNKTDAFFARWVEYGHYARVSKAMSKSAKGAGRALGVAKWVPAHPFMRPAFETKKGEAIAAAQDYLRRRLPEVATLFHYLKAA